MKKVLLLTLFISLVFACSSDDSSDNSNQTFLERFDGKLFERSTEIGQAPAPAGNVSFGHIKFENSLKFYSVTYPKSSSQSGIIFCAMYSEGINDFRGQQLSCQGCEAPNEINTFTILENTKDRLKFSWKMDIYNNGITDSGGNVIDDVSYVGIWTYEVNNGNITEIVQNEMDEVVMRANLQETSNDFNVICNDLIFTK